MPYVGTDAQRIVTEILSNEDDDRYPMHEGATGYFLDNNVYVAFDNTTCDCFVEEFATKEEAIHWIEYGNE